jgi:hypothetical protein
MNTEGTPKPYDCTGAKSGGVQKAGAGDTRQAGIEVAGVASKKLFERAPGTPLKLKSPGKFN